MFIAFEGVDGSGKTTQINLVAERLKAMGGTVHVLADFTDPKEKAMFFRMSLSEKLDWLNLKRQVNFAPFLSRNPSTFLSSKGKTPPPLSSRGPFFLLYDRYIDSTLVYQGETEADCRMIKMRHWAEVGIIPDLTFLFDFSTESAFLQRMEHKCRDKLDDYCVTNYHRLRNNFLNCSLSNQRAVVDAQSSVGVLTDKIVAYIRHNVTLIRPTPSLNCLRKLLTQTEE